MSTLTQRHYRGPFADIVDLLESPWTMFRPANSHLMLAEDYIKYGTYVVRAELPGLNPDEDLEVRITKGVLTISATRHDEIEDEHRSEFRYGTFSRAFALPEGADTEHVRASYDKGIVEVVIALKDPQAETEAKRVPVTVAQHIEPT